MSRLFFLHWKPQPIYLNGAAQSSVTTNCLSPSIYEVQTFMFKSFFLFQVFSFPHTFPMIRRTFPILSHVGPIPMSQVHFDALEDQQLELWLKALRPIILELRHGRQLRHGFFDIFCSVYYIPSGYLT